MRARAQRKPTTQTRGAGDVTPNVLLGTTDDVTGTPPLPARPPAALDTASRAAPQQLSLDELHALVRAYHRRTFVVLGFQQSYANWAEVEGWVADTGARFNRLFGAGEWLVLFEYVAGGGRGCSWAHTPSPFPRNIPWPVPPAPPPPLPPTAPSPLSLHVACCAAQRHPRRHDDTHPGQRGAPVTV